MKEISWNVQDRYDSPATETQRVSSVSATLGFHSRNIWDVIVASGIAKRGELDCKMWVQTSLWVLRNLESNGVQISTRGLAHLRSLSGPAVIIGNHMSVLETFILPCFIQPIRPVTFVVKRSLVEYPVFKHIMRSRNPVVVGRVNARADLETVMREGQARLKEGISVVLFPQSTRTPHFDPEQFNSLGVKLARRAAVPVVPLALRTDAWENGSVIKDFGWIRPDRRVHFEFTAPMEITGNGTEQHATCVNFITSRLKQWSEGITD